MKNKHEDAEEEILFYIKIQGLVSWTDLEKEFTIKKGWSKGRFVEHWKNVKPYLDELKDPKSGRTRYKIKDQFKNEALKALLKTTITRGEIHDVEIPLERFNKVAEYIVDRLSNKIMDKAIDKTLSEMKKAEEGKEDIDPIYQACKEAETQYIEQMKTTRRKRGISQKIKDVIKPAPSDELGVYLSLRIAFPLYFAQKEEEQQAKANLMQVLGRIRISILSSPGETMPSFTDEEIAYLFYAVGSKIVDENKGKPREKPFHLIVSFPMK